MLAVLWRLKWVLLSTALVVVVIWAAVTSADGNPPSRDDVLPADVTVTGIRSFDFDLACDRLEVTIDLTTGAGSASLVDCTAKER